MQIRNDTIAAVSTPLGRGAIAIIRLSGCDAHQFGAKLANPWPRVARQVTLSTIRDARDASVLDRVLITRFDAPHSYTGEPMVEMACHGGLAVSGAILEALVSLGARPADAGEFSQRAVLNGKMDLLQAEGVADLIDARTQALRRVALSQIDGSLTRALGELRERAIEVEALLAYDIDFPEEDDGPISRDAISAAVDSALAAISRLLDTVPLGEVARDGALVVIAGPPNAGKSSLFNALLGHTRSIVAELAGTTRDAIEARVESEQWPLRLVDTAGLRETTDLVEQLGIEVSEHYLQLAQVVLVCAETPEMLVECSHRISGIGTAERVAVLTKSDRRVAGENAGVVIEHSTVVEVSVVSRDGLERLLSEIHLALKRRVGALDPDLPMVTRMRHRVALEQARSELHQFILHWEQRELPSSVAAIHVRTAIHALDELIGSVDVEDVLDRVFRTFCVGK